MKKIEHDITIVISKRKDDADATVRTIHVIGMREWKDAANPTDKQPRRVEIDMAYTGADTLDELEAAVITALKSKGGVA